MSRRPVSPLLLLAVALGCTSDQTKDTIAGGVRLEIRYDSSLDVDAFIVFALDTTGAIAMEPVTYDAPLFLEPPGLRVATVVVEVPFAEDGLALDVRIDGTDDGDVVGSARTGVTLSASALVDATVRLGAPTACGDGRVHPTLEGCDDGNTLPRDGCNALCVPEVGFVCRGAPSLCTACGNGTVEVGEICDDGNRIDGDGCSAVCEEEAVPVFENVIEVRADRFQSSTPEATVVPGSELQFTVAGGESWLVFVSGAMGAGDEAELTGVGTLMIDGVERDRFGHQTFGLENNEAGFLTFVGVMDEGDHSAHLEFASTVGEAWVQDVRMVAARLPEGADFQYFESDQDPVRTGEDQLIDEFTVNPRERGEYVFLAKASVSEDPGDDTSRTWVVGPTGRRHPNAPAGVGYSNGRGSLAPMFVAFQESLEEPGSIRLYGTSSGFADGGWWDAQYNRRRPLDVANVPAAYAVSITFDHESMVNNGRARPDGRDIRIVWTSQDRTAEIDRVLDPQSSWGSPDTRVWFSLPADPTGVGAEVHLYYDNVNADVAPQSPSNVFTYFTQLDDANEWTVRGNPGFQNGRMMVPGGAIAMSAFVTSTAQSMIFETRMRFTDPQAFGPATYWGAALGVLPNVDPTPIVWFEAAQMEGHIVRQAPDLQSGWGPSTPDSFRRYSFVFGGQAATRFMQDEFEIATFMPVAVPGQDVSVVIQNGDQNGNALIYDWVRIRPHISPEPVVTVGAVQGPAGVSPSSWRYRRFAAFRADAFDRTQSSMSADLVTTTSTFTEVVQSLETDVPPSYAEYLVIQSARIAGDSSATAAKSGVLLADGDTVLRTQHRITRDDSADSGYHHVAGAAHRRVTNDSVRYENGVASPDGIRVSIAESSILVFRYSSAR